VAGLVAYWPQPGGLWPQTPGVLLPFCALLGAIFAGRPLQQKIRAQTQPMIFAVVAASQPWLASGFCARRPRAISMPFCIHHSPLPTAP